MPYRDPAARAQYYKDYYATHRQRILARVKANAATPTTGPRARGRPPGIPQPGARGADRRHHQLKPRQRVDHAHRWPQATLESFAALRAMGMSYASIARLAGCSRQNMWQVLQPRIWTNITFQ